MTCVNSKRVVLAICAPVLSPSVLAQAAAGAPAPPATDTAATSASALFVQRDQLQTAIAKRDAKRVTAFIRSGMDLNFNFNELAPRQRTGESPLTMAINRERLEIARLLLDAKADPNRNDDFGRRPIHCARSAEAVRLLVQFGADPNARIEFDDTITKPLAETALADRAGTPHPGPLPQAERGRSPDRNDALPPTEIAGNRQGELTGMRVGPLTWAVLYGRGDVALQLWSETARSQPPIATCCTSPHLPATGTCSSAPCLIRKRSTLQTVRTSHRSCWPPMPAMSRQCARCWRPVRR